MPPACSERSSQHAGFLLGFGVSAGGRARMMISDVLNSACYTYLDTYNPM